MTDNDLPIPNDRINQDVDERNLHICLLWIDQQQLTQPDKDGLIANVKAMTPQVRSQNAKMILKAKREEIEEAKRKTAQAERQKQMEALRKETEQERSKTIRADFDRDDRTEEDMSAEIIKFRKPGVESYDDCDEHIDNNEYTIVENWLLEHPDPRIKGREIAVYTLLDLHCHMPMKTCWVSITSLAERTGWDRETVRKGLRNLEAVGAIEREQVGSRYKWTIVHRHRTKSKKGQRRKRAGNADW